MASLPLARPHLGKWTCASSAKRSRMLPPVDVTPPLSKAFRYSRATDLRCSSGMVRLVIALSSPPSASGGGGVPGGQHVLFHPCDEGLPVPGDPVPRLVEGVVPDGVAVGVGRV